ncbi:MAG: PepSY domain-containing protein [Arenicellaceae bacterium]|nr:PepSY domain-containing protein [Arenicellaceae bacterium]
MKLKTALYLSHRWLGIFMCLLFIMWFFSGVVMMYIGYPELTLEERYAGTSKLAHDRITYSPSDLLVQSNLGAAVDQLILTNIADRPVYLQGQSRLQHAVMYADSGEFIEQVSPELAVESARSFYRNQHQVSEPISGEFKELLEMDQWSISSSLSTHRPLHLISIEDAAGTNLYVSSRTGQVVLDTTRRERFWNWLGSNIHWIYPLQLRKHSNIWGNVIIVLSLIGLVSVITGAIIGIIRLRFKHPYRGKDITPYKGMVKYHHIVGLMSLVFLLTYMFSGLMSMAPWGLFDSDTSFRRQVSRYQYSGSSSELGVAFSKETEIQQLLARPENQDVKQIVWHRLDNESYVAMHDAPGDVRVSSSLTTTLNIELKVEETVTRLIPMSNIVELQKLDNYDAYYYSHHSRFHPLPILRIKFDDRESNWFHIDLKSGQVLGRMTLANRVQRWLFNGFHSLDFTSLIYNRPIWDVVVIMLCGLGMAFSITSAIISWRRIGRFYKSIS